ncbi:MAG: hypothetical protein ACFFD4_37595 [Candidatus Odinarchaeota archaeon]
MMAPEKATIIPHQVPRGSSFQQVIQRLFHGFFNVTGCSTDLHVRFYIKIPRDPGSLQDIPRRVLPTVQRYLPLGTWFRAFPPGLPRRGSVFYCRND